MKNSKIAKQIELFKSKACCKYTQYQAIVLFRSLKNHLSNKDLSDVQVAWSHAMSEEGPSELFKVYNNLVKLFKGK